MCLSVFFFMLWQPTQHKTRDMIKAKSDVMEFMQLSESGFDGDLWYSGRQSICLYDKQVVGFTAIIGLPKIFHTLV